MKHAPRMPEPAVYELEYQFWPWGRLLARVASWVHSHAPQNGVIVDYMCGTGYLLNDLLARRSDLQAAGCSITESYIDYARMRYPRIHVSLCDAMIFEPISSPDIILCTAGLHHLARELQPT